MKKFIKPIKLSLKCDKCKNIFEIEVDEKDYDSFINGEKHVQDAFPYLRPGERELLLSGMCNTCFDEIFKNLEEDEEY